MALTLENLKKYIVHAITGGPSAALPGDDEEARKQLVVNIAGRYLYNARQWNFRNRPNRKLHFAGPISVTGATFTHSTRTLTSTGAFANYTHSYGDRANVTGGTGATTGEYEIESKISDNEIVLSESIGSDADGQTDIDLTISFPYVNMPDDFGQLLTCRRDGLTTDFALVDYQALAEMRDHDLPAPFLTYGALFQPAQSAQTSALSQWRMEIYPTPTAAVRNALTLTYRAKWRELTDDTHYAAVPDFCEPLLIEFIRAVAEGFDNRHAEQDGLLPAASMMDRIQAIKASALFRDAVNEDSQVQPSYGVLGEGLIGAQQSGMYSFARPQDSWTVPDSYIT